MGNCNSWSVIRIILSILINIFVPYFWSFGDNETKMAEIVFCETILIQKCVYLSGITITWPQLFKLSLDNVIQ